MNQAVILLSESTNSLSEEEKTQKTAEILDDFFSKEWEFLGEYSAMLYGDLFDRFKHSTRQDGSMFVEHLIWVYYLVKDHLKDKFTPEIGAIALLHDIIEDTGFNLSHLCERYWDEIAICVELLSKPSRHETISRIQTEEAWNHWNLSIPKYIPSKLITILEKEALRDIMNSNNEDFIKAKKALDEIREYHFFSKFDCKEWLKVRIKNICNKLEISKKRTNEVIEESGDRMIVVSVLVKLFDRLHNHQYPPEKKSTLVRALKSTLRYFSKIPENFPEYKAIYQKLEERVIYLYRDRGLTMQDFLDNQTSELTEVFSKKLREILRVNSSSK